MPALNHRISSFLSRLGLARNPLPNDILNMRIPTERLRDDDQFIASYPRSGNRWMRTMVNDAIVFNRPDLMPPNGLQALVPDFHQNEPDERAMELFGMKSRILKSHNLRAIQGRRMVYLFRRAADALISYYHFHLKQPKWEEKVRGLGVDEFCETMLPTWVEHLEMAVRQRETLPERTCLIAYEVLHASPFETLRRALIFLGIEAADEVIRKAVENNSFANSVAKLADKKTEGTGPILRQGRVGGASDELQPETMRKIEAATASLYDRAEALAAAQD